ncbi:BNR-4 repeat-containing protein [Comamonas aquatica]|uniref:BNR repeat-containing protein n=1 Tax=Comamonas aquatica TaxID=225991 RepID=UPI00244A4C75|nr:BNR repeat-containing protein [Comamonas aquatica]MDH1765982.1 BNR-4 repeat-containing protein [Comamonas aquatica]
MNSTTQALPPLMDFLQDLMPPSHITLVGAGNGKGRWAQWLSAVKVPSTLVEADEQQFAALQHVQAAGCFTQAQLLHAVVAAEAGEVEFHTSSLATESGLLSAEAVQQLWPNVHTLQAHQRHATALTELLAQQHANQWLVLDCFPAASLLKAAASALSQLDVVVARVVLTENKAYQIPGAGLAELTGLLPAFTQLALQPTRHPDIAYALLVRDYRRATTQALKAHAAEGQAKQAAIQAQQTLQAQLQQAAQQNADLLKKQDLQAQAQKELEANLASLQQEKQIAHDTCSTAVEELQKIKAEFQKTRQTLADTEKLAGQRSAQVSACELRISQLQALSVNQSSRDSQLQEALISVSAQWKLLKSLLPKEIGQAGKDHSFEISDFQEKFSDYKKEIEVKQLDCIELGEAWAGNTVNTVIFRHHGIFTKDGYQYTAFYIDESTLRVVQRQLENNNLHTHDIKGQFNLKDAHNSISLGMDRDSCLHISYDHHATRLRYRRSLNAHDIQSWTDELPMTGAYEEKVTYPSFILPRHNFPLTMLYRDGHHNKGSARIKVYDEKGRSWKDYSTAILSGADNQPWTSNAYWNHPAIGTDGTLHLSFVWRTGVLGEKQLVNNVNIGYAWSPDNGLNWFTSLGQPCQIPMTQVNAETVWSVSPGSNLINQCSMALDSKNRPHIAFYVNDINGVPQYHHLWFDGAQWFCTKISERDKVFNLQGGGTLQIPISRPEIVIDDNDHVFVIYRGDLTGDALAFSMLEMKCGKYQVTISNEVLWPEYIEYSEPVIDRERWAKEKNLSFFIQRTAQPDGDKSHELKNSDLKIVDIQFE